MTPFTIIIDSREQAPFLFDTVADPAPATVTTGLKTGDYSLQGFEDQITIERKSMVDLFGSCGKGRARFEREFKRMQGFKFAGLVIEAQWKDIYTKRPSRSQMDPKIILRTIIAWTERYGVHCWACPGKRFAEKVTYLMLDRFYRDFGDGKI